MSGRGQKKRGRPPKTPVADRDKKFQYHLLKKPKYLVNRGSDSQLSTPSVSRASSPQGSDGSRRSISRPSTSRKKRGSGRRGGHSTGSGPYQRRGEFFLLFAIFVDLNSRRANLIVRSFTYSESQTTSTIS